MLKDLDLPNGEQFLKSVMVALQNKLSMIMLGD